VRTLCSLSFSLSPLPPWQLFCSFSSTFALNLFLSSVSGLAFAQLGSPGLVDFGVFSKVSVCVWVCVKRKRRRERGKEGKEGILKWGRVEVGRVGGRESGWAGVDLQWWCDHCLAHTHAHPHAHPPTHTPTHKPTHTHPHTHPPPHTHTHEYRIVGGYGVPTTW